MNYLSVCSGIEAASVAWTPLGWHPAAFAEIEAFPSAVLRQHYPAVENRGDMTRFMEWPDAAIDVLVGGTPCQSYSVAGLRKGLDDPRGALMLVYLAIARRYRPKWMVWENVPGVLSSDDGRAFGTLLGGLALLGYGFAYRILDAQYFRLAQRRRRVFVVGHLGDWRRAAAVLFERESLSGHPAPRRTPGEEITTTLASRARSGSGYGPDTECPVIAIEWTAPTLDQRAGRSGANSVATSGGLVPMALPAIAFAGQAGGDRTSSGALATELSPTLHKSQIMDVMHRMQVRRLTPCECERLQGFPDDYTLIPYRGKPAADGPRYKALGNSMAVPVMRWIGQRIAMVNAL
jgi:DNA (cytosine-5)-methyltransferase 1